MEHRPGDDRLGPVLYCDGFQCTVCGLSIRPLRGSPGRSGVDAAVFAGHDGLLAE